MHILQHRSIRALSVVDADALFVMAVRQAVYTHRLDVAERLASVLSSTSRPAEERAIGYHVLAYLAAAQGRWRIARTYADSTRLFSFHYGVETKARLAVVPLAPYATSELTELRREVLTARTVHAKMGKGGYGRYAASQYPDRMVALAGMLSARIGDTAALHSATMALATDDTSSFRPWREWRRDRLGLLRAWSMRIAGRSADAV
ncbi:MAG TPA: hypothetical protein VJ891_09745, partial [Casimicrobiaceae bacterium]|nr:hypothetical protein [Casimicrobiaceae bacterium]